MIFHGRFKKCSFRELFISSFSVELLLVTKIPILVFLQAPILQFMRVPRKKTKIKVGKANLLHALEIPPVQRKREHLRSYRQRGRQQRDKDFANKFALCAIRVNPTPLSTPREQSECAKCMHVRIMRDLRWPSWALRKYAFAALISKEHGRYSPSATKWVVRGKVVTVI